MVVEAAVLVDVENGELEERWEIASVEPVCEAVSRFIRRLVATAKDAREEMKERRKKRPSTHNVVYLIPLPLI